MAYKVFTNGSVLQASEVNDNLMKQAVAVFSNAAARTAAISSPVEGQLSYLEDVDRYEWWSGSAWRSPFGSTFINSTTFTSQTSVTINNVFSSLYDNYVIDAVYTQNSAGSGINFTLVNGGTPAASQWAAQQVLMYATNLTQFSGPVNSASVDLSGISAGVNGYAKVNLMSPFLNRTTFTNTTSHHQSSGSGRDIVGWTGAQLNNSTSYEGFRLSTSAGTLTGTIKIYGIRN